MEPGESGVEEENNVITVQVTPHQESAMEAFFQMNGWQVMKESKEEASGANEGLAHTLSIRVTPEQEAAMDAFFQINNWKMVKDEEGLEEGETDTVELQVDALGNVIRTDMQASSSLHTLVEEVQGLQEVKVTATGMNGQSQIITVYTEGGAHGLPQSLLTGEGMDKDMPQVIIQEITLPEGMMLDQGLVIANPTPRRVVPRGTVKPGDKIHKCHVCGKTFKQAQSFNGHYQSHFGAKPYQCEICNTGFTLKAALVAHNSIHTGAKPFPCQLCHKSFRRKDDMISHVRTHTGEKPYECDLCGKKFKYRNQIPKHRRAHTGEKPYQCSTCEKAFTSNIHLRRHERVHTGERPYKCLVCNKAFTQYGHLQAHTRIHTDERPFACTICGRGFREKKVMKKHEALHTAERPYKCEECGKGFLRQSNLELHAVMHQKPSENGLRVRPRPKKKKQPESEMREFVANVLSNVKKVDSGMQTDSYIQGIPTENETEGADNLSALVNVAVEQEPSQTTKVKTITGLPEVTGDEQYTLIVQEDGSESYLISNYDTSAVNEEIITLPSTQVEISTSLDEDQKPNVTSESYIENPGDMVVKSLEKIIKVEEAAAVNPRPVQADNSVNKPKQITVIPANKGKTVAGKANVRFPQINVISGGQTIASIPVRGGKIQLPAVNVKSSTS